MPLRPVRCQKVIVEHVNDYAGVMAVLCPEAVFALGYNGMGIRECIDGAVQINSVLYVIVEHRESAPTFDKVGNEIPKQQFFVVSRQVCMGEEVHKAKYKKDSLCRAVSRLLWAGAVTDRLQRAQAVELPSEIEHIDQMKHILTCFLVLGVVITGAAQRTVIHCGKLIDGKSDHVQTEMTITVEGNKIVSVEKGYRKPGAKDKLIDLKAKTVLPGLIDMHVHLESEVSKDDALNRFVLNDADIAFQSAVYARVTLLAGFTTVRDLGGSGVNIALRNAVNKGLVPGPRIFTAGKSIATTGGHADPTNGYSVRLMGNPGPRDGVVNSPEEARQAVRQHYKDGADLIKITATGGVLSLAKDGSGPQFTDDELKAIIETARDYGMHTAAHAHGTEGMKRAVLAGITTIEHGTRMTEEVMDLMKERGTYYVPTIIAGKSVGENARIPGYFHPLVVPKALEIGPAIQETFRQAYKRGVKIAFGTDSGVSPHGQNAREFGYMVEVGMPPMEAIKSATSVNAGILKMGDQIGSLEAGKLADIIATDDDPVSNIRTLESVFFVMKDGVLYKNEGKPVAGF